MKFIKKVLLSILLIPVICCSICLVGCQKDNSDNEVQLDGVNVVLSLKEADQLLNQAKLEVAQVGGEILQSSDINAKGSSNNKYTKADLLLIINQIKNIWNNL